MLVPPFLIIELKRLWYLSLSININTPCHYPGRNWVWYVLRQGGIGG